MTTPLNKTWAIAAIIEDARRTKNTTTSAKRLLRATRILGLNQAETVAVFHILEYCDEAGERHHESVAPVWRQKGGA